MTPRDGFPPTQRIAHAISMGHYRRSLVLADDGKIRALNGKSR